MGAASETSRRAGGAIEPIGRITGDGGRTALTVQDPPGRTYELLDRFSHARYRASSFDEMAVTADRIKATRFTAIDGDGTRTDVRKADGRWTVPPPPRWMDFPQGQGVTDLSGQPSRAAAEQAQASRWASLRAELHERFSLQRSVSGDGGRPARATTHRARDHGASFTESGRRIETDSGRHDVIRAMVDVAELRGWKVQRVSGSEDFKRQVWLESTARNIATQGYEPKPWDLEMLSQARDERGGTALSGPWPMATKGRQAAPRAVSPKTVLTALDTVLRDRQIPPAERQAVLAATAERLAQRNLDQKPEPTPAGKPPPSPSPQAQPTRPDPSPTR